MPQTLERCANCSRAMDEREKAFLWMGNSTVCEACYASFKASAQKPSSEPERAFVPGYASVRAFSRILFGLGFIGIVGGTIVIAIAMWLSGLPDRNALPFIQTASAGASLVVSGFICAILGGALECLRDIAINSFYTRNK